MKEIIETGNNNMKRKAPQEATYRNSPKKKSPFAGTLIFIETFLRLVRIKRLVLLWNNADVFP